MKKAVEKNKAKLQNKIDAVLSEIGQAIDSDLIHTQNQEDIAIDSQKLEEEIQGINQNANTAFLGIK